MHGSKDQRLCEKCQVHVVDFTQKSNQEIIEYLSGNNKRVCGRLYANQLSAVKSSFNLGRLVLPSFLALTMSFYHAEAQAWQRPSGIVASQGLVHNDKPIALQYQTIKGENKITILGEVIDAEDKMPLPQVTILIKDTNYKTSTTRDGLFSIEVPQTLFEKRKAPVLIVRYLGYAEQEHELKEISKERLRFTMEPEAIILGEVITTRRGIWSSIKSIFRRKNKPKKKKKT